MDKHKVKHIRMDKKMSIQDLANYLDINASTVWRYEQGKAKPRGPVKKLLKMLEDE